MKPSPNLTLEIKLKKNKTKANVLRYKSFTNNKKKSAQMIRPPSRASSRVSKAPKRFIDYINKINS